MIPKKSERLTSQKRIIFEYLFSTKTHPSAKEVYLFAKKRLPQISKGTVYRILNELKEKGKVKEIHFEVAHFDADLSPHSHFICQKCKKIFDLQLQIKNFEDRIFSNIEKKVGKVKSWQIILYGFCKNCQK